MPPAPVALAGRRAALAAMQAAGRPAFDRRPAARPAIALATRMAARCGVRGVERLPPCARIGLTAHFARRPRRWPPVATLPATTACPPSATVTCCTVTTCRPPVRYRCKASAASPDAAMSRAAAFAARCASTNAVACCSVRQCLRRRVRRVPRLGQINRERDPARPIFVNLQSLTARRSPRRMAR